MKKFSYAKVNYKYQLKKDEHEECGDISYELPVNLGKNIEHQYYTLDSAGSNSIVTAKEGYCWDGPSGPTFDSEYTLRASLIHDVLYQIIREHKLTPEKECRKIADIEFGKILIIDSDEYRNEYREKGMFHKFFEKILLSWFIPFRMKAWFHMVRIFGKFYVALRNRKRNKLKSMKQ